MTRPPEILWAAVELTERRIRWLALRAFEHRAALRRIAAEITDGHGSHWSEEALAAWVRHEDTARMMDSAAQRLRLRLTELREECTHTLVRMPD